MKLLFKRYDESMKQALSGQPLAALLLNAVIRGLLFALLIQAIAFFGGLQTSSISQLLLLALIFSFIIASIDIVEKYAARARLGRRN